METQQQFISLDETIRNGNSAENNLINEVKEKI